VREAGAHAERLEHPAAELDARAQLRLVRVAEHDLRRRDPLVRAAVERLRVVLGHALEHGRAVDAHRVVRELLALDELLEVDLLVVPDRTEDRAQLGEVVGAVRVGRPRAGHRFDDHGVADRRGRGCGLLRGAHAGELRHAQAVRITRSFMIGLSRKPIAVSRSCRARRAPRARARRAPRTAPTGTRRGRAQAAAGGDDAADRVVLVEQSGHLQVVAEVLRTFSGRPPYGASPTP
jgi:hypothetical protein